MTDQPAFIHNGQASSTLIEVADGRTLDNNSEGTFVATSNGVPLPPQPKSYSNSKLTTTLLSGPKIVYEHNYDVVLSRKHGNFMQPSSAACPICHPHDPEYADRMKLPKRFSDPLVTNTIDTCHCCDRTKMTKNELPGEVEHHHPAPLEEIHLDLFTYPNDPRYDAIFIDRASRYVWHYALSAKSDLPKTIQQFIIDANVLTGLP